MVRPKYHKPPLAIDERILTDLNCIRSIDRYLIFIVIIGFFLGNINGCKLDLLAFIIGIITYIEAKDVLSCNPNSTIVL